jgi:hypothetical protein
VIPDLDLLHAENEHGGVRHITGAPLRGQTVVNRSEWTGAFLQARLRVSDARAHMDLSPLQRLDVVMAYP